VQESLIFLPMKIPGELGISHHFSSDFFLNFPIVSEGKLQFLAKMAAP